VVVPVQAEWDHWRRVRDSGIPLVFVNRDVPELDCDMVGVDYERGSYEATSHLIAGGARSLLLLEEDLPITTTADRISGFRRAMTDAGLPVADDLVRTVPTRRYDSLALPWQPEEAYRFAQSLNLPDGIVTGNDYFALGLLRVLAERGLPVRGVPAAAAHHGPPARRRGRHHRGRPAAATSEVRCRASAKDVDPPGAGGPGVDGRTPSTHQPPGPAESGAQLSVGSAGGAGLVSGSGPPTLPARRAPSRCVRPTGVAGGWSRARRRRRCRRNAAAGRAAGWCRASGARRR